MGFAIALHFEDHPEVYSLALSQDSQSLIIKIDRGAADFFGSYLKSDHRMNGIFIKELGIPDFIPATEKAWGFGEVIQTVEKNSKGVIWECRLPGRGEKAGAVQATLRQFFVYIDQFEGKTDNPNPQYLAVTDLQIESGQNNSNLWVNVSSDFCRWLADYPEREEEICKSVKASMELAYGHLWKVPDRMDQARIKMYTQPPKGFGLQVPGDACFLEAGSYPNSNLKQGFQMGVHNADYKFQQLTLLCGLAKLWEIVKE